MIRSSASIRLMAVAPKVPSKHHPPLRPKTRVPPINGAFINNTAPNPIINGVFHSYPLGRGWTSLRRKQTQPKQGRVFPPVHVNKKDQKQQKQIRRGASKPRSMQTAKPVSLNKSKPRPLNKSEPHLSIIRSRVFQIIQSRASQ